MKTYLAEEANVKIIGRTHRAGDALWLVMSGSGVEFTVAGTRVEIDLLGDAMAGKTQQDEDCARIGVEVNGERVQDFMMNAADKTVELAFSGEGGARVRLLKLSESAMSMVGIGAIRSDGEIAPAPQKNLLLEVIGDSITCGYGVDDEDYNHNFHTSTEDVTRAYGYRAAQALQMDYSMFSFSGYGIISGYTDSGNINERETLPQYYEKVGYCKTPGGRGQDGFRAEEVPWSFEKRQPDLIVINLGTNDSSYCREVDERRDTYRREYVGFLKKVREKNPDAAILCVLGIMGDELYPWVEGAVADYRRETGDTRITSMPLEPIRQEEGYVADWHPTAMTHERIAKVLTERIRRILEGKDAVKLAKPVIALTFDDGPNTTTTVQVLDKLAQYGVPATFFLIGKNMNPKSEEAVKRACGQGCAIENHSINHACMSEMPIEEVLREIEENSSRIEAVTGRRPAFFRPPYIAVSEEMRRRIGLTMIAGYGAEDWKDEITAEMRAERILEQSEDGAILLLHDQESNFRTVDALDSILPELIRRGYHLVTVEGLFANKEAAQKQGVVYSHCVRGEA